MWERIVLCVREYSSVCERVWLKRKRVWFLSSWLADRRGGSFWRSKYCVVISLWNFQRFCRLFVCSSDLPVEGRRRSEWQPLTLTLCDLNVKNSRIQATKRLSNLKSFNSFLAKTCVCMILKAGRKSKNKSLACVYEGPPGQNSYLVLHTLL